MAPLSVGDKVLVQNQTGRAPNKWDKSGAIVECKPHNQVNVMMDGSRKVSLRNRQFVRKIETQMPVVSSGVKPSQFVGSQHDEVADGVHVADVQGHGGENAEMVEQGAHGQVFEGFDRNDTRGDDGGALIDDQIDQQDRVENVDRGMADTAVDQQPVARPKRNRKPNSKYDPVVYDLDSVQIKEILVSGRKNGWRGFYWPK